MALDKYIKPKSLTWWAGLGLALIPIAKFFGLPVPEQLPEIIGGLGLVGLRGAVK